MRKIWLSLVPPANPVRARSVIRLKLTTFGLDRIRSAADDRSPGWDKVAGRRDWKWLGDERRQIWNRGIPAAHDVGWGAENRNYTVQSLDGLHQIADNLLQ